MAPLPPSDRTADDDLLVRRATLLEVNGRRVNEAIQRGAGGDSATFVCECGHLGCTRTVQLAIEEYEAVRTDFDRFFVLPGHEIGGVDEVVERHDRYLVVHKTGEGAALARAADPRARG